MEHLIDADNRLHPRLRLRKLWLTLGWASIGLILYLSLTSRPPDLHVPGAFDVGHVLAYLWLTFWFSQIYRTKLSRTILAVALCLLGISVEILQGLGGHRLFEYSDMALNTLGIALGLMLARTRLQNTLLALETRLGLRHPR